MIIFSKFVDGIISTGGVLTAGVVCVILYKGKCLPPSMGPFAYGITTLGIIRVLTYCLTKVDGGNDGNGGSGADGDNGSGGGGGGGGGGGHDDDDESDDDPDHDARMAEFYRLKPKLERMLREQSRLAMEFDRYRRKRDRMMQWANTSKALNKRLLRISKLNQKATEGASTSSNQEIEDNQPAASEDSTASSETDKIEDPIAHKGEDKSC